MNYLGATISIGTKKLIFNLHKLYNNYKPKPINNFNISNFEKLLANKPSYDEDISHIKNGFPLWIKQHTNDLPPLSKVPASFCHNEKEFAEIVETKTKELEKGFIEPYPLEKLDYVINVFCVPKKDEFGKPTLYRVVRNGSWKAKNKAAINDYIDSNKTSIPTLPNLIKYVQHLINHNFFALRDLKNQFRQILLLLQKDFNIGYYILGLSFRDRKQPYGVASAPANAQSFSNLLIWIMKNKFIPKDLIHSILVHIDDFVLAAKYRSQVQFLSNRFDLMCKQLNVRISVKKNVETCQKATIYGIVFDLKNKTLSIPKDKKDKIIHTLKLAIEVKCVSAKLLHSIIGKIMHLSQLYRTTKSLCYNSLKLLYKHIDKKKPKRDFIVQLTDNIIMDFNFWLAFFSSFREVPMKNIINKPDITFIASTDASNDYAGFICNKYWSHFKIPPIVVNKWTIAQKEAYTVLDMIHNMKHILINSSILLFIDNQNVHFALKNKWAKTPNLMRIIYEISLLSMQYNISIWSHWIPSRVNIMADMLSRRKFIDFRLYMKTYKLPIHQAPLMCRDYFTDFKIRAQ